MLSRSLDDMDIPQATSDPGLPDAFFAPAPQAADGMALGRSAVYRHVLAAIRDARLAPAARLPSARRLARAWGVARGAVDDALQQLQQEGLIERRVGRGSFVARRLPPGTGEAPAAPTGPLNPATQRALKTIAPLLRLPVGDAASAASAVPLRLRPRATEIAQFPLSTWRACMAHALADGERASLHYGPPGGVPPLREAAARYLALTRSIVCRPEQVIIINNPLQGIDLIARALLEPGDRVCVEDPGYVSIPRCLSLAHMAVSGIAIDEQGFDVAAAQRQASDAAAVYLHPLGHFPTGVRTSATRRAALLDWADRCGAWIIEGDQLGEIVHDKAAPPPLHCTDRSERVVYVGSFNGVMFPGLRLAYMVVPLPLVEIFTAMRGMMGDHSAVLPQLALARFIDEGHLSAHLRVLRALYGGRRSALVAAAERYLPPGLALGPMGAGVHAGLALPQGVSDVVLAARLETLGLGAEPMSAYGWRPPARQGLVLGYGVDDAAGIGAAMLTLGQALAAGVPLRAA